MKTKEYKQAYEQGEADMLCGVFAVLFLIFLIGGLAWLFTSTLNSQDKYELELSNLCHEQGYEHINYSNECYQIVNNRIVSFEIKQDKEGKKYVSALPIQDVEE